MPNKKVTLNLAPADLPKDGTSYDLPMALAILQASGNNFNPELLASSLFIGELSLDGTIRPVKGIISHIEVAKKSNLRHVYIPAMNSSQAALISGINIIPVKNLGQVVEILQSGVLPAHTDLAPDRLTESTEKTQTIDFADVQGQAQAKRALEIAAAGNHNILLNGSPGAGKTMLARALLSILPPPGEEEIIAITKIHSLAGESTDAVTSRPFRSPHHTSSSVAIIGGGKNPKPGEISLSHHGVLFLDEIPEYPRSTLEALRQPLEDRIINISRASQTSTYPANFMLVATQNPCPCGYYLDGDHKCTCSYLQVQNYQKKLSGPLLDRIDLAITVQKVNHDLLLSIQKSSHSSQEIKKRVIKAREKQILRFGKSTITNSIMTNNQIKTIANLDPDAKNFLDTSADKLNLSARSYMKTIKVARTIADLDDSKNIQLNHIIEALQYRHSSA